MMMFVCDSCACPSVIYIRSVVDVGISVSVCVFHLCIFFFKQKTAYEMRISDWSSDVCSSDLFAVHHHRVIWCDLVRRAGAADQQFNVVELETVTYQATHGFSSQLCVAVRLQAGLRIEHVVPRLDAAAAQHDRACARWPAADLSEHGLHAGVVDGRSEDR